jgi:catechol 2,3-dioxygenase-like lactoylglutathione lyase family enzyme
MDWKLEVVVVPVADIDRSKAFYVEQLGFRLDVDHRAGEDFRIVQLTPSGSACSVTLMKRGTPGSLPGLQMVVNDIDAARAELVGRGVETSELFHFGERGQTPGPDPAPPDYGTFFSFEDPDGNSWLVQEVGLGAGATSSG